MKTIYNILTILMIIVFLYTILIMVDCFTGHMGLLKCIEKVCAAVIANGVLSAIQVKIEDRLK